jgi:Mlc titration factor MtfA (ptsG expression regulator)
MFGFIRKMRRRRLARREMPEEWLACLNRNVPFFPRLPEDLKKEFLRKLKIFVREKTFYGAEGMEITDEVRVVISAAAVRLVLHLDMDYYNDLREIIVYPYILKVDDVDAPVLGQATPEGVVVLSWPAVLHGLRNPRDGLDASIHEFAHILDVADGSFDGTPLLKATEDYRPWIDVLGKHFEKLRDRGRKQRKVIRGYGALNPAEFLAVATEAFFEKSTQMKKHTPDLYEELHRFYGFDPASDSNDGIPTGKKIGRNDRCPCGSGRKYKRCCGK